VNARITTAIEGLHGRLVVSCQAPPSHPLDDLETITRMAQAAEMGGAGGLRLAGADTVMKVLEVVKLPVIGIEKTYRLNDRPLITSTFEQCVQLAGAGANIVAIEATIESPHHNQFEDLVRRVHDELGIAVMADVSTLSEGLTAWESGADLVGTTLAGYTSATKNDSLPAFELIAKLHGAGVRTVLEGHVQTPTDVAAGFSAGAWCVVAGKAITDPLDTTRRFARAAALSGDSHP